MNSRWIPALLVALIGVVSVDCIIHTCGPFLKHLDLQNLTWPLIETTGIGDLVIFVRIATISTNYLSLCACIPGNCSYELCVSLLLHDIDF